ncbi:YjjG family noncanonical pyrimidine nucleotidase [Telluribacter sp. SYSU D00476]|uniref:YjjG family noncanonical pyrimidine nucleotidase n=1 Tax=Telluribacter sp. SYSU D00476 TaxID=2811430 RepID=UPI001FF4DA43|nr:YjjG family noncanonical pyrimidine nucleotidase [Telluribacter sp. SYSU D00476]
MKYKHLFFDLDHTLWDFERNSSESLLEIFERFELAGHGVTSCDEFIGTFSRINLALWKAFDQGTYTHTYIRENRFRMVFEEMGLVAPTCCSELGECYLELLPQKKYLLEGALDVLDHAAGQGYVLHIVTNGFDHVQAKKMQNSGIFHYFTHIITNEKAQAKKPDPRIFAYALELARARHEECIMIGDNWEADILGAKRFGLDTVYYNPLGLQYDEVPTHDIRHLHELKAII